MHALLKYINKRKDTPKEGSCRSIFPQKEDEALLGSNKNVLQPSLQCLPSKDFRTSNRVLAMPKEDRIPAGKKEKLTSHLDSLQLWII